MTAQEFSNDREVPPKFALPSPLGILQTGKKLVAIYSAADSCRVYDVMTGELLGVPIKLAGAPTAVGGVPAKVVGLMAARPKVVRIGIADNGPQFGLMFYEPHPHSQNKDRKHSRRSFFRLQPVRKTSVGAST